MTSDCWLALAFFPAIAISCWWSFLQFAFVAFMADFGTFSTAAQAVSKATCPAFKNILENKQKTFNVLGFYFILFLDFGILLLLWEKNVLVIFWMLICKIFEITQQSIQTVKGQYTIFNLFLEVSHISYIRTIRIQMEHVRQNEILWASA